MTATSASVRFGADGVTGVESFVRLTGRTYIRCCTYGDSAPILAVDDAHVDMSMTVPDPDQVTEDDVATARLLAEAVGRVRGRAGALAVATGRSAAGPGDGAGQAA